MFKIHLLLTLRHFRKQFFSSIINLVGLTLAITTFIFIILFVVDEFKYDSYHENKDVVSRLLVQNKQTGKKSAVFPAVEFQEILESTPELEKGFRILCDHQELLSFEDKKFFDDVYYADSDIFEILTLPALRGNLTTALNKPFSVVITEKISKKYFGNSDPLGKILRLENTHDFEVTAVLKNIPIHSHIYHEIIASISTLNTTSKNQMTRKGNQSSWFYFQHNKNVSRLFVQNKLNKIIKEQNEDYAKIIKYILEPLDEIYLYSTDTKWDISKHGDIRVVVGLGSIAILIMLMAAFNFTNLLSAQVKFREKEMMIRKLLGAGRRNIIKQYLFETFFYISTSLMISLLFLELLVSSFNLLINKNVQIISVLDWKVLFPILFLLIFISLFSVLYPAIITLKSNSLSRLSGSVMNNEFNFANIKFGFKQIVTIIQFAVTVALIFGSIIIYKQMQFINNSKLGFNKEHLLVINNPWSGKMFERYKNYKNTILTYPGIISVSASGNNPGENINNYSNNVKVAGQLENEGVNLTIISTDFDLFNTWQVKLLRGRDFSEEISSDIDKAVIINQAAVELLKLENPIGARLNNLNNSSDDQVIIGVVENVHFKSFKEKVLPTVFYLRQWSSNNIVVRIDGDNISETMSILEKEWDKVLAERPFVYSFLDERFNMLYSSEERLSKLILIFCGLAITISFIGLLSLISLIAQMRTKEIGIRKILGASNAGIYKMMVKEYVYIIIFSSIVSLPIAYFIINNWLQQFVYRTEINSFAFIISIACAFCVGLSAISFRIIKSAKANPVDSLRNE